MALHSPSSLTSMVLGRNMRPSAVVFLSWPCRTCCSEWFDFEWSSSPRFRFRITQARHAHYSHHGTVLARLAAPIDEHKILLAEKMSLRRAPYAQAGPHSHDGPPTEQVNSKCGTAEYAQPAEKDPVRVSDQQQTIL